MDAAVQMIDTSIVRVHQHAACIARNGTQSMGRSRGGLTSKIPAVVDSSGLPVRQHGAWANIPPKSNRRDALSFSHYLYRARNLVERFFNKIKQCRRVAPSTTSSRPTTLPSFNLRQFGYGCA